MSLLDREDPRGAPERHREALLRAEKRLDAAASDAVRAFLTKVRASVTPRSLTAATGGDFPQAAHLFALGEAQGWWQEAVDEHIAGEVAAAWRSGYFDTRDGDLLRSSQEAVGEYVANISDRLSRTATPTLPEAAFDKARVALSDEMARGSSTRETSQRLAAEFGWDEDARFWRGRKEELTGRIESILDPYGPPGTPDREWQRLNNAEVRDLQRQSSEATKHIDAVQSEWQTRADRIARTETTAAYNAGSLDAGKREGAGVKVWMANADDRTRETHLDASNECVPVDDAFDVGGVPMQMPGDPSAPPEETINCRCTVLFATSCEEADAMYPVMDPERAHEQALAEDRMREAPHDPSSERVAQGIETLTVESGESPGTSRVSVWDPDTGQVARVEERAFTVDTSAVPAERRAEAEQRVAETVNQLSPEHRPPNIVWEASSEFDGQYDSFGSRIGTDTVRLNPRLLDEPPERLEHVIRHESFHRSDQLRKFTDPGWEVRQKEATRRWMEQEFPGGTASLRHGPDDAYFYPVMAYNGDIPGNPAHELFAELVAFTSRGEAFRGADILWEAWLG